MRFKWKDEYSVGVEMIDEQHKDFVNILNQLYDSVEEGTTSMLLDGLFGQMINFANYHFETEEKYFELFDYEGKKEHIAEHKRFKKIIKDFSEDIKTDKLKLSFDTIDFLEDWLVNHLNDMDKKYTKCFNEHGLK